MRRITVWSFVGVLAAVAVGCSETEEQRKAREELHAKAERIMVEAEQDKECERVEADAKKVLWLGEDGTRINDALDL
jgi:hypothetical protein